VDHTAELLALHEKARKISQRVPRGSDLYWDLMDATTLPWEERKRIKDAIRRGKAWKEPEVVVPEVVVPEVVVPEVVVPEDKVVVLPDPWGTITVTPTVPLPVELHYISLAGDHETTRRRLPAKRKPEPEAPPVKVHGRDYIQDYFMIDPTWQHEREISSTVPPSFRTGFPTSTNTFGCLTTC
jgi:hypothetical protein